MLGLCLSIATAAPNSGGLLVLRNQDLQLTFDPVRGRLVGLGHAEGTDNVLDGLQSELWEAELGTGPWKRISTVNAKRFRCERARLGTEALRLTWSDFGLAAAPRLQVIVTVALERHQPLSRWSFTMTDPGDLQFQRIHFPRIARIARQAGERLAVPVWMGQQTGAAREMLAKEANHRLEWEYPGLLSMQCVAISSHAGSGLYRACDDTAAFHKTFAAFGNKAGELGVEIVHLPERGLSDLSMRSAASGIPASWALPYQVLLGTLDGDWITAAERYRSWATNQSWALQSRLRTGAVLDWARNTGVWVWNRGRSGQVLEPAAQLQRESGLPVSVFCTGGTGAPMTRVFRSISRQGRARSRSSRRWRTLTSRAFMRWFT